MCSRIFELLSCNLQLFIDALIINGPENGS